MQSIALNPWENLGVTLCRNDGDLKARMTHNIRSRKVDFERRGGHSVHSQVSQMEEKKRRQDGLRPSGICQVSFAPAKPPTKAMLTALPQPGQHEAPLLLTLGQRP